MHPVRTHANSNTSFYNWEEEVALPKVVILALMVLSSGILLYFNCTEKLNDNRTYSDTSSVTEKYAFVALLMLGLYKLKTKVIPKRKIEPPRKETSIQKFEKWFEGVESGQNRRNPTRAEEKFLRSKEGRRFARSHLDRFLSDRKLSKILLKAYPPKDPKNRTLYFKATFLKHTLFIDLLPELPSLHPEWILKTLAQIEQREKINIFFYGSRGIDLKGLTKQLITNTLRSLIKSSTRLRFEKTPTGRVLIPQIPNKVSAVEKKLSYHLGAFFAFAYNCEAPTGEWFDKRWLYRILLFEPSHLETNDFSAERFLSQKSDPEFLVYMQRAFVQDTPEVKCLWKEGSLILQSADEEEVMAHAERLNALFNSLALESALMKRDISAIRRSVRQEWQFPYLGSITLSHKIAQGFIDRCSESWETLQFQTISQFSKYLQGKLSPKQIHKHLQVVKGTPLQQNNVAKWIHTWIDQNAHNKKRLGNLMEFLSGSRAITDTWTVRLFPNGDQLIGRTCFSQIDLPASIEEDSLRTALYSISDASENSYDIE